MKKFLLTSAVALFSFSTVFAQEDDKMLFNHLSVGVTVGTTGLGFDVATTCTPYLQLRAGVSFLPLFKANEELDLGGTGINEINNGINEINSRLASHGMEQYQINRIATKLDVEGKVGFTNGKILVDFFPFKSTGFPFFITAGAYFGTSGIVSVYNKTDGAFKFINQTNEAVNKYNQIAPSAGQEPFKEVDIYAELGEYQLRPDNNGNMKAEIKVNGFKPYLGIGFGRPVPKKNRVGFVFELGCQFWGSPKVYCNGQELKPENLDSKSGDIMKKISKISVYPVLNFRLCGRIL